MNPKNIRGEFKSTDTFHLWGFFVVLIAGGIIFLVCALTGC